MQNSDVYLGRLRFDEYNFENKASVYELGQRYSVEARNITEICNIDYVCIDNDLPSIHLRLPLDLDSKLESNPKLMQASQSYIKERSLKVDDDENPKARAKEKHYFKNVVYLPEKRIFHGVIDHSDSPSEQNVHYLHYTFELSVDF